jgi:hypothetical protein
MSAQETYGTGTTMERGKEVFEKAQQYGSEAYQRTTEAAGEAYDKAAGAVSGAYDQAISYGRENPATMTMVAFGIGVGVGLLLAGTLGQSRSQYRFRSVAEPVVNAISDIARDYLK